MEKILGAWKAGPHGVLLEETLWICDQYHTDASRGESEEHRSKTYHILVLQGKLQKVARWIIER